MPEAIEVLLTIPIADKLQTQLRGISPRLHFNFYNAQKPGDIPPEIWAQVEILYTGHILPQVEQVPSLKWLQFHYAGIDRFVDEPIVNKDGVKITTLSGAAAPHIAEHALALMMALARQLPALMAYQKKAEWPKDRFSRYIPFELRGKTVGIVGYGSIGRQLAWLLQPFNVTVLATKRDLKQTADTGYCPEGSGDPGGDLVRRFYPPEAIRSMVRECQVVFITAPLTRQTHNLLNARVFDAMPAGSYLVDVSRGGIVEHTALLNALKDGKLAGAGLDVFPDEPLAAGNPLWAMPNVMITPHVSGASPEYNQHAMNLFAENLYRYISGLTLYNLFDPKRGY